MSAAPSPPRPPAPRCGWTGAWCGPSSERLARRELAAQRLVERCVRRRGVGVRLRELILGVELRALGVEHLEEVGHPTLEAEARKISRPRARRGRVLDS